MGKERPETGKAGENAAKDPRKERLAAALRENLKRRKAQARGKAAGADDGDRAED
jgi:UDP-N-acetylglucosamine 2-epimerase